MKDQPKSGLKEPWKREKTKKTRLTPGYRRTRSISPRKGHRKENEKEQKKPQENLTTLHKRPHSKYEKIMSGPHSKN